MKFTDTLRGLLRRWYLVVPGIILTALITVGAWSTITPGYYRSSTQLLLPGANSVPEGANPYLFLGGLAPAADVLVRALGSQNVLNEMAQEHPGVEIKITRDTTTAGPIIVTAVTARSDQDAKDVLGLLVDRTSTVLADFQQAEKIPTQNRMTVIPVTIDNQSVLQQRTRYLGAAGAAIGGLVLTLFIAGLVDGLAQQRKRRKASPAEPGNNSHASGTARNDRAEDVRDAHLADESRPGESRPGENVPHENNPDENIPVTEPA